MDTKFSIEKMSDGVAVIATAPDGTASSWRMQGDQIEKHMRGIDNKEHPFHAAPRGELSAARDIAHEAKKQLES